MSETLKRAAELLRQYGWMANTVKAYHGDETLQVAADLERMAQAEPVAWVRFCSDGCYEGPIMNEQIGEVRKKSGAWTALHAAPSLPRDVLMAVARKVRSKQIQIVREGLQTGRWIADIDDSVSRLDIGAIVDQHAAAESAQAQQPADLVVCNWHQEDDDCSWNSSCGVHFMLNDGTPSENGMEFCHKCGKTLAEHPWQDDGELDDDAPVAARDAQEGGA